MDNDQRPPKSFFDLYVSQWKRLATLSGGATVVLALAAAVWKNLGDSPKAWLDKVMADAGWGAFGLIALMAVVVAIPVWALALWPVWKLMRKTHDDYIAQRADLRSSNRRLTGRLKRWFAARDKALQRRFDERDRAREKAIGEQIARRSTDPAVRTAHRLIEECRYEVGVDERGNVLKISAGMVFLEFAQEFEMPCTSGELGALIAFRMLDNRSLFARVESEIARSIFLDLRSAGVIEAVPPKDPSDKAAASEHASLLRLDPVHPLIDFRTSTEGRPVLDALAQQRSYWLLQQKGITP